MEKIIRIINSNNYSINLKSDYRDKEKINAYYPTFNNMKMLEKFLLSIENNRNGSVILSGAYGTGKSYFVALLISILGSEMKYGDYELLLKKTKNVYDIAESIKKAKKKRYLIVFVDDSKESFSEGVFSGIKKALEEKNIEIQIDTKIDIILKKLEYWKDNHKNIYDKFKLKLEERDFFKELEYKTDKVEKIFSQVYYEEFGGEKFYYDDKCKNIKELLEEVEKKVKAIGYEGIIYIFDEFGRYLEMNIAKIDVKEIQDMAEYCNLKNSSNLLMITHKDIFQYTQKMKDTSEKDEWEKVSGRFLKEHLIYEKTNILDMVKNIIQKENYKEYRDKNSEIQSKEKLLKYLIKKDEKRYTQEYFPLDYVTALILPDLSQKLAQNERTIFAFICSDDTKGLKNIIFDKKNPREFVTLDCIYDYFEREMRQFSTNSFEYSTYLLSKNILLKLPKDREKEKRVVKALATIYINNNFSEVEPNIETLRYILGDEKLDLHYLEENNHIIFNKYSGYYKLLEAEDLDIIKKIKEFCEKKVSRFDYMERLEKTMGLGNYYPLKYNDMNKINRYMGQYYVDIGDLNRLELLKTNSIEDGRIIYLTNIDGNDNYKDVAKILKNSKEYILVEGNGEKLDIYQELKELEAISLLQKEERIAGNEVVKLELEYYINDIKKVLKKKIDGFFDEKIDLLNITDEYLTMKYPKYLGVNYEMINKRNLSIPMKKARYEILKKIQGNVPLTLEYFNDTKAENSVARVILKNTGLYSKEQGHKEYEKIQKLMLEILEDIKAKTKTLEELYLKYCSNLGEYGLREGYFTFLLGVVFVEYSDKLVFTNVEENGEIEFSLEDMDSIEKNPMRYNVSYFEISQVELEYLEKLEKILYPYIKSSDKNICNRILDGIKNYLLNQPRYAINMYLGDKKGLNRIFKNIFTISSGKEFLLGELPKIYRTTEYQKIAEQMELEIIKLEESKIQFVKELERLTSVILSNGESENFIEMIESKNYQNLEMDIRAIFSNSKDEENDILLEITKKIKGFSYENWRKKEDIEDYENLLRKKVEKIIVEEDGRAEYMVVEVNGRREAIKIDETKDIMEKMLSSKIMSSIKNMGLSLTLEQKKRVVAKILMEMKE